MRFSAPQIINSELKDLEFIFGLFDSAIQYQKMNGYEQWPQFSKELIITEINEKRHWKIVANNVIIGIFSVQYNDPVIWMKKDDEPSVYLHRIAVNPLSKGRSIMNIIRDWAIAHARAESKKFVRMDTWGNNENLRKYYMACGFNYIGQQFLTEITGSPMHYGGSVLSLFELKV